jgi:hypothetical protein
MVDVSCDYVKTLQIDACGGIKYVFVELELELCVKLMVLELELAETPAREFFLFFRNPFGPGW